MFIYLKNTPMSKGFTVEIENATEQEVSINLFSEGYILPSGISVHAINNTALSYPELLVIAQMQNFSGEGLQVNGTDIPITIHTKEGQTIQNLSRVLTDTPIIIDGYNCYLSISLMPGKYILQLL
jgi:hypothetical protein